MRRGSSESWGPTETSSWRAFPLTTQGRTATSTSSPATRAATEWPSLPFWATGPFPDPLELGGTHDPEKCFGATRQASAITGPEEAAVASPAHPGQLYPGRGPWAGGACPASPFHFVHISFPLFLPRARPCSVPGSVYLRESYIGIKAGWFYLLVLWLRGAEPAHLPLPPLSLQCPFCGHLVRPVYAPWTGWATRALGVQAWVTEASGPSSHLGKRHPDLQFDTFCCSLAHQGLMQGAPKRETVLQGSPAPCGSHL